MKDLKLNWKYVVYIIVGIVLVILAIVTGTSGLSKTDREIYEKAIEVNQSVNGLGFTDFDISKYKVRFFDGDNDYVVSGEGIEKEDPALETFVGTTVEVEGEFQVLLPTYDKFSQMFTALSTAGNLTEGNFSFGESDYNKNSHIATLCHEAFHTWQFAEGFEKIEGMAKQAGITEDMSYSEIILNEVDSNKELVLLFEQEMELLFQALEQDNIEQKKELVEQVLNLHSKRDALLSPQAVFIEQYYETIEGSARYVEACIYKELEEQQKWSQTYMAPFSYENGSGKYYEMGMLKCMILDQLAPEWKESFDAVINLNILLQQEINKK